MKYCKYHPINPTQILMLLRLRFAMIFNQLCSAFFSCLQPNCCKCHNIQSHLWLWQQGWVFSYPHLYKMIVLLIVGWLSYWFLYKNTDSWPNCKSWSAWLNSHVCSLPASLVILLFKSFFFFFFLTSFMEDTDSQTWPKGFAIYWFLISLQYYNRFCANKETERTCSKWLIMTLLTNWLIEV